MKVVYPKGLSLRRGGTAAFLSLTLFSLTGCIPSIELKGAGASHLVTYDLNRDTQVWIKTDCKTKIAIKDDYSSESEVVCIKETLKTPPAGIDGVK